MNLQTRLARLESAELVRVRADLRRWWDETYAKGAVAADREMARGRSVEEAKEALKEAVSPELSRITDAWEVAYQHLRRVGRVGPAAAFMYLPPEQLTAAQQEQAVNYGREVTGGICTWLGVTA